MLVKSEFFSDRLAAWKDLPKSYLISGCFLLLFGLLAGFFLAAVYWSENSALPGPNNASLPVGIRICPEPQPKSAPAVQVFPIHKQDQANVVPEKKGEISVPGPENEAVHPALNGEALKAEGKLSGPVPEVAWREVLSKAGVPHHAKEGAEPVVEIGKAPLTAEAGPGVSGRGAENNAKQFPQKEMVDQNGIDKILATAEFRIYTTAKEDTLWRVAEKCYGSGYYFPVLMECNPSLQIYDMEAGTRVKIIKDNRLVQRLYNKITRLAGNELYFYYRVNEGDTFDSIAGKFYNKEGLAKRIEELNPHGELLPGKRIRIALE